jgi:hypothetical protein
LATTSPARRSSTAVWSTSSRAGVERLASRPPRAAASRPARPAHVGQEQVGPEQVAGQLGRLVGQAEGGRQVLAAQPGQAEDGVRPAGPARVDQHPEQGVGEPVGADRDQQPVAVLQGPGGDRPGPLDRPGHRRLGDHPGGGQGTAQQGQVVAARGRVADQERRPVGQRRRSGGAGAGHGCGHGAHPIELPSAVPVPHEEGWMDEGLAGLAA